MPARTMPLGSGTNPCAWARRTATSQMISRTASVAAGSATRTAGRSGMIIAADVTRGLRSPGPIAATVAAAP